MHITKGDNYAICQNLDSSIFNISEVKTGINLAPLHTNCDCIAEILDKRELTESDH